LRGPALLRRFGDTRYGWNTIFVLTVACSGKWPPPPIRPLGLSNLWLNPPQWEKRAPSQPFFLRTLRPFTYVEITGGQTPLFSRAAPFFSYSRDSGCPNVAFFFLIAQAVSFPSRCPAFFFIDLCFWGICPAFTTPPGPRPFFFFLLSRDLVIVSLGVPLHDHSPSSSSSPFPPSRFLRCTVLASVFVLF